VACPYTEVESLIRSQLVHMDEAWRCECALLFSGELKKTTTPLTPPSAVQNSPETAAAASGDWTPSPQTSSYEPQYIVNEVPLLNGGGLNFDLTVHLPYRPLKTLIRASMEDSQKTSEDGGLASLPSSSPHFITIWDGVQRKALAYLDVAMASDAILTHAPSTLAAGALMASLALDEPQAVTHSIVGVGGLADGGEDPTLFPLFPGLHSVNGSALSNAGSHTADLKIWLTSWLSMNLHGDGMRGALGVQSTISAFLLSTGTIHSVEGAALLAKLEANRDPRFVKGSNAYETRLTELRVTIDEYKAGKKSRSALALKESQELHQREDEVWGVLTNPT